MTHRHVLSKQHDKIPSSLSLSGVAQRPGAEKALIFSCLSKIQGNFLVPRRKNEKRPCLKEARKFKGDEEKEEAKMSHGGHLVVKPVTVLSRPRLGPHRPLEGTTQAQLPRRLPSLGEAPPGARRRPSCSAPRRRLPPLFLRGPWEPADPVRSSSCRRPASRPSLAPVDTEPRACHVFPDCALRQTACHASTHRPPVQSGS